jgi:hypothetical protein
MKLLLPSLGFFIWTLISIAALVLIIYLVYKVYKKIMNSEKVY